MPKSTPILSNPQEVATHGFTGGSLGAAARRRPRPPPAASSTSSRQSPEELAEESRQIRRLQMVVNMVTQVIAQDSSLTVDEASEMVADTRRLALGMFPDKELAFDLIYWPRLQRLMRERFRMQ